MKRIWILMGLYCVVFFATAQKINRYELMRRHNVHLFKWDSLSALTVGNGKFAFTSDITGLQSFPLAYKNGISLGTQSNWGWHSFVDSLNLKRAEALKEFTLNGKEVSYLVQWNDTGKHKQASDWFRQNPHRLQLGNVGFKFIKNNGSIASIDDIKNVHQWLDIYTGTIYSNFTFENELVNVTTFCNPKMDQIQVQVKSNLLKQKKLQLQIQFPYPTGAWNDEGVWYSENKHTSELQFQSKQQAILEHRLDTTNYFVNMHWSQQAQVRKTSAHVFVVTPIVNDNTWNCSVSFFNQKNKAPANAYNYELVKIENNKSWKNYWQNAAAIDFSGSTDTSAFEIERRVVLSQYLMHVQEDGSVPSQETGLINNSWFGKPHLEMTWWHLAHYGLWNGTKQLENILNWYQQVSPKAIAIAKRQGYEGARWQKMTDLNGDEVPSTVGAFLIWQQPHPIYFAALCYRAKPNLATLEKYKSLVFLTANFMCSFANYDSVSKKYNLGKGVIAAQERYKPEETFNPTYELVYWKWALQVAQDWRIKLKLPINKKWQNIIDHLATLPVQDGKYLFTQNATDAYTNPKLKTDHPSVLAAYGVLPLTGQVDQKIMDSTFNWVWNHWDWKDTWGWDFPMTAMTATRLGKPQLAIDALLMPIKTNTYLPNGHNYQDNRLRLYMPGNGGILTAIAMMVAGYDGATEKLPGIPKNGKWKVRYEGLKQMP
jgi:hypothetical protein